MEMEQTSSFQFSTGDVHAIQLKGHYADQVQELLSEVGFR